MPHDDQALATHEDHLARIIQGAVRERVASADAVADVRVCTTCARPFSVARGEMDHAYRTGLSVSWTKCRRCRPTRRQLVAGAKAMTIPQLEYPVTARGHSLLFLRYQDFSLHGSLSFRIGGFKPCQPPRAPFANFKARAQEDRLAQP
jgi:hypothetical protein